ncbi:MAG: hypothetical protein JWP89_796 [Schlesneria sp.]|nr:hypothetical protein [Schlesneria sp.]
MNLSPAARYYLGFCLMTCSYFTAAAVNAWPGPTFGDGTGRSSYSSGGGYIGGYGGGRSSGGFGGGGK